MKTTQLTRTMIRCIRIPPHHLFALACVTLAVLVRPASAALGDVDPGFNATLDGPVRLVTVQSDGRILVAGEFTEVNGTPRSGLARLNSDGSLDPTFRPPAWPNGGPKTLALRPDGRILAGLLQLRPDGSYEKHIAVISEDVEEEDPDYRPSVGHVLVQPDGKVLIAGYFTHVNGFARTGIARLHADGSLDSAFHPVIQYSEGIGPLWHIAFQSDGKILIGGDFSEIDGQPRDDFARLNADGTVDTGFSRAAEALESSEYFVPLPDGKILMAGGSRLNPDGTIDASFVPETGWSEPILVQPDGRFLAAAGPSLSRRAENGSRETHFNSTVSGGLFQPYIHAIGLQADGKVLIGGDFTLVNGAPQHHLARLLGQPANEVSVGPLRFVAGQPGFDITSTSPRVVVVEASTNLLHWDALQFVSVTEGPARFSDPVQTAFPCRFYRVAWQP